MQVLTKGCGLLSDISSLQDSLLLLVVIMKTPKQEQLILVAHHPVTGSG